MRGSAFFWKKRTVTVHEQIADLCKEGDALASAGKPDDASHFDKAADELTRAYIGGGIDIFMEDDPKYLEFLETRIPL